MTGLSGGRTRVHSFGTHAWIYALVLAVVAAGAGVAVALSSTGAAALNKAAAPHLASGKHLKLSPHKPTAILGLKVGTNGQLTPAAGPAGPGGGSGPPPALPGGSNARAALTSVQQNLAQQLSLMTWSKQAVGTADLNAVSALDNTHAWAVGNGCKLLVTVNGAAWSQHAAPSGCTADLTGISMQDKDHGWAVGNSGTILVCSAQCDKATATWSKVGSLPAPLSTASYKAVWGSGNTVYAAGVGVLAACSANCTSAVAGSGAGKATWANATPATLSGGTLNAVYDPPANFAIAVGTSGKVFICKGPACNTGANWLPLSGPQAPPTGVTFNGAWIQDNNTAFAVGAQGGNTSIWACTNACNNAATGTGGGKSTWADVSPVPGLGYPLNAVGGGGPNDVWAVGNSGTILGCFADCTTNPAEWVSEGRNTLTSNKLNGVSASDPKHAYAVGVGGVILTMVSGGPPAQPAGTPSADDLTNALGELGRALLPSLWIGTDGNHVDPTHGGDVFNHSKKAVQALTKGPGSGPSWVTDAVNGIGSATRLIATTAINDNSCSPSKSQELTNAGKERDKGDDDFGKGHPDTAVDHYGNAWDHAMKALGTPAPCGGGGGGGITLSPSGAFFTVTNMLPLDTVTTDPTNPLVTVTDAPAAVSLAETVTASAGKNANFAHDLLLKIVDTTNSNTTIYDGPLDAIGTLSIPGTGGSQWATGESHNFKFDVTFPNHGAADNALQNASMSVVFTWTRNP